MTFKVFQPGCQEKAKYFRVFFHKSYKKSQSDNRVSQRISSKKFHKKKICTYGPWILTLHITGRRLVLQAEILISISVVTFNFCVYIETSVNLIRSAKKIYAFPPFISVMTFKVYQSCYQEKARDFMVFFTRLTKNQSLIQSMLNN